MTPPNTRSLQLAKQAALHIARGDLKRARQPLRRILSTSKSSPHDRAQAHFSLARIAQLQGNWDALDTHSHALLNNLFELDPNMRAEALRMRALLSMREGNRTQHLQNLHQARALFQSSNDIESELATLAQTIETLLLTQQTQEAYDLLNTTLQKRAHELPEPDLHGFCIQRALLHFSLQPNDTRRATVEDLIEHALQADHIRVVAVMRIRWAQTLLKHNDPEAAIDHLNKARLAAVANADIVIYTQAALALAQAYEANNQKPEAYGTLLRAKTSLQDIAGPNAGALPQLVLDQLKERWTPETFEEVVQSFHSSYTVLT